MESFFRIQKLQAGRNSTSNRTYFGRPIKYLSEVRRASRRPSHLLWSYFTEGTRQRRHHALSRSSRTQSVQLGAGYCGVLFLKPKPDPNEEGYGPRSLAADNGFGSPLGIRNKVRRFGCPAGHLAEGTRFETNAPNLI